MGGGGHNVPFLKDDFWHPEANFRRVFVASRIHAREIIFPEGTREAAKLTMIGNSIQVSLCS